MHVYHNLIDPEPGEESGAPVPSPSDRRKLLPQETIGEANTAATQVEPLAESQSALAMDIPAVSQSAGATKVAESTIDGAALLDELSDAIGEFVKLEKHERDTVAVWLLAVGCRLHEVHACQSDSVLLRAG